MSDATPPSGEVGGGLPSGPNPSDRVRVEELFREALALPAGERRAFLEGEEDSASVRARVLDLLEAHDAAEAGHDPLSALVAGLHSGRAATLLREAPDPGPDPGDAVGRYRVLRRLGRGGMGTVYEAHDPVLDRSVALKLLPPSLDDGTRLLQEARAAGALDHPGIGTVHEVFRDAEGRSFLVMASYTGGTLRSRIRAGPLLPDEAVRIALEVAEALDAAHVRGILHRDVKPENLLFDESGRVKVVDFGIAAWFDRGATPAGSSGTPAYLSPERAAASGAGELHASGPDATRAGQADDLWALGVVFHEMLTGRHPSFDAAAGELRGLPADLDPALAGILHRALARDPAARFPSAAALARALRDAGRPAPPLAPPTAPPPASPFAGVRGRRVAALAGVVALLLFVAGAVVARQGPRLMEARGFAGDAFTPRGMVLVTEFSSPAEVTELAQATREALVVDLQQSGYVRVLPRAQVEETLVRMGYPRDTPVEGSLALEVAERAGAGAVVETVVARAGTRYVLSGRALASTTGDELFSVRTSAGERGLLGAVERLSREMRLRLGEASASLAESRPLSQVTTASMEALRLYTLAERAMAFDPERVPVYLEAALDLDPGFAMAHRLAAAAGINRMRFEDANHHLGLAWEHRDRLADRERWLVEAAHASEVAYQPYRAEELYQRIVARFPDDFIAWANLGNGRISWLMDPEGAHLAFLRSVELDPEALRTLSSTAGTALLLGRPEQADALMARATGPAFESMQARWRVTRAFWHEEPDELRAACRELVAAGYPPAPPADDREVCGSMLLLEGDLDDAILLLEPMVEDYLRRGSYRNLASIHHALAVIDLLAGDTARAREHFLAALDEVPPEAFGEPDRFIFRTNLEIPAILFGWPDVAERVRARYPPLEDPGHLLGRGGRQLARAAEAVMAGDGEAALEALEAAFPPGVMAMGWRTFDELLRGMAFELLGEDDLAASHYERARDRGWGIFPGLTKDRLNILLADEGLARLEARRQAHIEAGGLV